MEAEQIQRPLQTTITCRGSGSTGSTRRQGGGFIVRPGQPAKACLPGEGGEVLRTTPGLEGKREGVGRERETKGDRREREEEEGKRIRSSQELAGGG